MYSAAGRWATPGTGSAACCHVVRVFLLQPDTHSAASTGSLAAQIPLLGLENVEKSGGPQALLIADSGKAGAELFTQLLGQLSGWGHLQADRYCNHFVAVGSSATQAVSMHCTI